MGVSKRASSCPRDRESGRRSGWFGTDFDQIGWPACGEIDIMENVGFEPSKVDGSLHGPGYSGGNPLTGFYALPNQAQFSDDYHVFAIEWEPKVIRFYVDGTLYETQTLDNVPTGHQWVFDHGTPLKKRSITRTMQISQKKGRKSQALSFVNLDLSETAGPATTVRLHRIFETELPLAWAGRWRSRPRVPARPPVFVSSPAVIVRTGVILCARLVCGFGRLPLQAEENLAGRQVLPVIGDVGIGVGRKGGAFDGQRRRTEPWHRNRRSDGFLVGGGRAFRRAVGIAGGPAGFNNYLLKSFYGILVVLFAFCIFCGCHPAIHILTCY